MLKFVPFLTVDKSSLEITCHSPKTTITNFLGVIQTASSSFRDMVTSLQLNVQFEKKDSDVGIYVSERQVHQHHIIYIDSKDNKEIQQKYQYFFQKIVSRLSSKIIFGDRSDYSRINNSLKDKQHELYMLLQSSNEIYKINSINDNRLQIGSSITFLTLISTLKQQQDNESFMKQLSNYFSLPLFKSTKNLSNLSGIYDSIVQAVKFRKQVQEFQSSMIDKATTMFKKQQINSLLLHLESLCESPCFYIEHLKRQYQSKIRIKNQEFKETVIEEIYQRYKTLNSTTYQQFRMQMLVKNQLIKYSVDQYLGDSSHYGASILYRISNDFCFSLFTNFKTKVQSELQTKQCLTNELDQQMMICESLKKQITRLNNRINDMCNIDKVLKEKENLIRELQAKSDKLRSSEILLEGENIKKDNLIKNLQNKIEIKNQSQKKLYRQFSNKQQELLNLSKTFKQMEAEKQELTINLKKKTQQSIQMRKIFHVAHQSKSVFQKKSLSQEKVIKAFVQNLDEMKQFQKNKARIVLNLNLQQHREIKIRNVSLSKKVVLLQKQIILAKQQNDKLKTQIYYFQKMFNQFREKPKPQVQSPLIVIEENSQISSDRRVTFDKQQRAPFGEINRIREQGDEWCDSSRKQCEKSIGHFNKFQEKESKYTYF